MVEDIAKALVDIPEAVSVRVVEDEQATALNSAIGASTFG